METVVKIKESNSFFVHHTIEVKRAIFQSMSIFFFLFPDSYEVSFNAYIEWLYFSGEI